MLARLVKGDQLRDAIKSGLPDQDKVQQTVVRNGLRRAAISAAVIAPAAGYGHQETAFVLLVAVDRDRHLVADPAEKRFEQPEVIGGRPAEEADAFQLFHLQRDLRIHTDRAEVDGVPAFRTNHIDGPEPLVPKTALASTQATFLIFR